VSEEQLELVRKGYEAWNSGDRSWVLEHMSEDVEWVSPAGDPDRDTYRGHAGVEKFWGQWREAVGQLSFELQSLTDEGDHVIAEAVRRGKGEHGGPEISDHVIQVFTFSGDKCVRVQEFYDRDEALRWVGAESAEGT
jgi:ketosteroid isomerase-like protein